MKQIISASVTPFTDDGRLDVDSAARLYEFGLGHRLDGFFIMGSMGEWALLNPEERDRLAETACSVIGNKAKVLLGISDTGMSSILRNMEKWGHLSHSHWTVILPGGTAGPADPVTYLHKMADRADRPLYFYYIPVVNGITLSFAQLRDVLAHPKIAGVKNSTSGIRVRRELLRMKKEMDFEIYEGEEWGLDESLMLGCDGAVTGFGSTGAKLMKQIAADVDGGDFTEAAKKQDHLIGLFHGVYGSEAEWAVAGQKYALKYMGIISSDTVRVPRQEGMPEPHRERVRACIDANREYIF